jgi:hypothetical protein
MDWTAADGAGGPVLDAGSLMGARFLLMSISAVAEMARGKQSARSGPD